jgi:hypothetical protein
VPLRDIERRTSGIPSNDMPLIDKAPVVLQL